MKISDENAALAIILIWEAFFELAVIVNTTILWVVLAFVTFIEVLIVYYEERLDRKQQQLQKAHELFVRQSENYVNSVREHDKKEKNAQ